MEAYAVTYGEAVLFDNARNQYVITRIKRILKRTVATLQYQLKKGAFRPEQFEVSFSVLEDLESVNIASREKKNCAFGGGLTVWMYAKRKIRCM